MFDNTDNAESRPQSAYLSIKREIILTDISRDIPMYDMLKWFPFEKESVSK